MRDEDYIPTFGNHYGDSWYTPAAVLIACAGTASSYSNACEHASEEMWARIFHSERWRQAAQELK